MKNLLIDALTVTVIVPQNVTAEKEYIERLRRYFGGSIVESTKGQNSYPFMDIVEVSIQDKGESSFRCRYGATNRQNMFLSIACNGWLSEYLKVALKNLGVPYWITRVDIAIDFQGDFESYYRLCSEFRKKRGVKSSTVGDWEDGEDGRTYYIGSRKSESYIRLYEKGKERACRGIEGVPPDLLRLELEFKPTKLKREIVNDFDPVHILSLSKIGTDIFNLITDFGIEPLKIDYTREDDTFVTLSHAVTQYKRYFREAIELLGAEGLVDFMHDVWGH